MNTTEKQFIDLLSNSIRNEVCKKKYDNVDWNELMNLSRKHKIEGLIYSALNKAELLENIDEDKVMMDLEKGQYFALNSVGSRIWEEIQSPVKISEVVNTLLSEYDVDRETCEKSVMEFIEGLDNAGLLSSN